MTEILCYEDSYLREFDATVTDATSKGVMLDRTAFYPGGGGQPADSGTLTAGDASYTVKKLSRQDGKLVHEIDGELPPVGASVHGVLDWDRRYLLMRTHTALHILCGVVWRDYGAQVTGGNMQPGSARMDFELENMSADFAERMETLINEEVQASRSIEIATLPREEAFAIPDLIRTKINLLPANDPGSKDHRHHWGWTCRPTAGPTSPTRGRSVQINVVGHESKGRINKRLRIRVE